MASALGAYNAGLGAGVSCEPSTAGAFMFIWAAAPVLVVWKNARFIKVSEEMEWRVHALAPHFALCVRPSYIARV